LFFVFHHRIQGREGDPVLNDDIRKAACSVTIVFVTGEVVLGGSGQNL